MNVEQMLEPILPTSVCGEDTENDDLLIGEIEPLLDPGYDNSDPPKRKLVEWGKVHEFSKELFKKGKHLRVALLLLESGMELRSLRGFSEGVGLIDGLLNRYWEEVYPNDPEYLAQDRSALLTGISDARFRTRLSKMPLVTSSKAGRRFSWEEIEAARSGARSGNGDASNIERMIEGICREEIPPDAHQQIISEIEDSIRGLTSIEDVLDAKLGNKSQVSFRELKANLAQIKAFYEPFAAEGVAPVNAGSEALPGVPHQPMAFSGEISTRDGAIKAMDKIITYFEQNEPSSPIPLLLTRAKRCVGKNFLELAQELAGTQEAFASILVGNPTA